MTNYTPVLLFAYNRPQHLASMIKALQANVLADRTPLFIYCDAEKNESQREAVEAVRAIARTVDGFAQVAVVERERNYGLAANVIDGVTTLVRKYGRVIVLEDDLITAPDFLTFMNDALERYKDDDRVCNVQAHVVDTKRLLPSTFFIRFVDSWGWATWERAWQHFEVDGQKLLTELETRGVSRGFDLDGRYPFTRMLRRQVSGENNSWAIRWNASLYLRGRLSLNAGRSLVKNIGFDGSGVHCDDDDLFKTTLYEQHFEAEYPEVVEENRLARRQVGAVFAYENSFRRRLSRRIKKMLKQVKQKQSV